MAEAKESPRQALPGRRRGLLPLPGPSAAASTARRLVSAATTRRSNAADNAEVDVLVIRAGVHEQIFTNTSNEGEERAAGLDGSVGRVMSGLQLAQHGAGMHAQ